jgi:hypothetical protein
VNVRAILCTLLLLVAAAALGAPPAHASDHGEGNGIRCALRGEGNGI